MKLLNGIFGRKAEAADVEPKRKPFPIHEVEPEAVKSFDPFDLSDDATAPKPTSAAPSVDDKPQAMAEAIGAARKSAVNIWDMDDNGKPEPKAEAAPDVATPDRASSRARRNRTRLIGFDTSEGQSVDLFEDSQKVTATEKVQFPVGWILVVEGPGRGHCFALTAGMAQIGRGDDQAIQLDFGDASISRNNHAAVVFDPESNQFLLGHGGKSNIVRLNGKPVISNEDLKDGDKISLGETVLQLKTLVGDSFTWDETAQDAGGDDDLAIA